MITLTGVLHVPDIDRNLISVASIVDKGFRVEFTHNGCVVSKGDKEMVIGQWEGNIYTLTGVQEVAYTGLALQKDSAAKDIWHRRIGHRSVNGQILDRIKKSVTGFTLVEGKKYKEDLCDVCW